MNEMTSTTRPQLGTYFRECGEEENWPQIALASEIRAIDLSCRACWRWAPGLDSRLATPNLRFSN